jgi:hypothetical protein
MIWEREISGKGKKAKTKTKNKEESRGDRAAAMTTEPAKMLLTAWSHARSVRAGARARKRERREMQASLRVF